MRKLLSINRIGLFAVGALVVSCGTSEDSVKKTDVDEVVSTDTVKQVLVDSTLLVDPVVGNDSSRAVTHGSPDQAKLDSIKKAKTEQKKK